MPFNKFMKSLFNKKKHNENDVVVTSDDSHLRNLLVQIVMEAGISSMTTLSQSEYSILLEFTPSQKLKLEFDNSIFADGFTESITRNIGQIWHDDFKICGEAYQKHLKNTVFKIYLPIELYPKIQWFIYLVLDGMVDKRIGRRWVR